MTRRHDLERRRRSLGEIRDIMNSMKTLAYMETRKLANFLSAQQAVVQSIEVVAADLLSHRPDILPEEEAATPVYLLIGSERGFCGDFNHALLRYFESVSVTTAAADPIVIAVGHKLHVLLEDEPGARAVIDGASVVEEVTALIGQVVSRLAELRREHGVLNLYCLYHGAGEGIVMQRLLPPFAALPRTPRFAHPPVLNQRPRPLLLALIDHYLFAALFEAWYTSLMAENRQRVAHLEGAVRRLDEQSRALARKCNALRQEEIIEEIEVILLSAASLGSRPQGA
jgi:F-type H+-transporting ATPase subunit gamma